MSCPTTRYQELGFKEALTRSYHYPLVCKELSSILREVYTKLPKNLQSTVFQDTLSAFRLLPEMQTRSAVSAAHLLFQSAEAVFPKQKKNLAVTEFKQAMIAHKRRSKVHNDEQVTAELPEDILLHIFSFLDVQSLVSVSSVCRTWNFTASNNHLWQSHYALFFGQNTNSKTKTTETSVDWKEAFKRAYRGNSSRRIISNRGYCCTCETFVWLDGVKCWNGKRWQQAEHHYIIPATSHQVIDYLLNGYLLNGSSSSEACSDSDSESEVGMTPSLWAYPKLIGDNFMLE